MFFTRLFHDYSSFRFLRLVYLVIVQLTPSCQTAVSLPHLVLASFCLSRFPPSLLSKNAETRGLWPSPAQKRTVISCGGSSLGPVLQVGETLIQILLIFCCAFSGTAGSAAEPRGATITEALYKPQLIFGANRSKWFYFPSVDAQLKLKGARWPRYAGPGTCSQTRVTSAHFGANSKWTRSGREQHSSIALRSQKDCRIAKK